MAAARAAVQAATPSRRAAARAPQMIRPQKVRTTGLLATLLALLALAPSANARVPEVTTISPADHQRLRQSASIGMLLHAHDRAAWVSRRTLAAQADGSPTAETGGRHVVEMTAGQRLRVTFYRGVDAGARAYFVTDVEKDAVVRAQWLPTPAPLTTGQAALARARETAIGAAFAKGYRPCTASPFNSVAIASSSGSIAVYLMTVPTTPTHYPVGGHYRIVVGPDGAILSSRTFGAACLNIAVPTMPDDMKAGGARSDATRPVALFATDGQEAVPTEIHVFASYALRLPLYVATGDRRLWRVGGLRIELRHDGR
ncbi:hypothetical protein LWE61_06325 [Sphingobium sufflavum]|uniref:hypothetical protein n=1 Tax=Sphingobium sufflavum TaxID=1129547 RepID=UPI001F239B7D|nr:hypothetical protein [Sphingobium sufflavum]MCE7796178.1 hypothetical protein [Sphingobium sufflavum]